MSVVAAAGFVAGGIACGIKESGAPDLAIVATEDHAPVAAAGVFTTNLAQAETFAEEFQRVPGGWRQWIDRLGLKPAIPFQKKERFPFVLFH